MKKYFCIVFTLVFTVPWIGFSMAIAQFVDPLFFPRDPSPAPHVWLFGSPGMTCEFAEDREISEENREDAMMVKKMEDFLRFGNAPEAEKILHLLQEKRLDLKTLKILSASICMEMNRFEEAEQHLNQFHAETEIEKKTVSFCKFTLYCRKGDHGKAIRECQLIRESYPDSPEMVLPLCGSLLTMMYFSEDLNSWPVGEIAAEALQPMRKQDGFYWILSSEERVAYRLFRAYFLIMHLGCATENSPQIFLDRSLADLYDLPLDSSSPLRDVSDDDLILHLSEKLLEDYDYLIHALPEERAWMPYSKQYYPRAVRIRREIFERRGDQEAIERDIQRLAKHLRQLRTLEKRKEQAIADQPIPEWSFTD